MNEDELAGLGILAGFGTIFFIFFAVCIAVAIVPYWFITKRLGWNPWWSLLMLVPPVGGLVWSYYVAFARWPIDGQQGDARPFGQPPAGL